MKTKFGVQLPQVGAWASAAALAAAARQAEEVGLDSIWVSDHIAFPTTQDSKYPYSSDGEFPVPMDAPWIEAVTAVAFVAALTSRVSIGTSVLVLPLRQTIVAAKQFGSLGVLAPGRIILGVGAGWMREEFDVVQADFGSRGAFLDEQIDSLRELWTQPGAAFEGEHVRFESVWMEPRPDPPPAIWVGGTSGAALRRAGRAGDAWHAVGSLDAEQLTSSLGVVRDEASRAGRDPDGVELTVRIGSRSGSKGIESLKRRLEPYLGTGCTHVVIDPICERLEEHLEFMGLLTKTFKD